MEGKNPYTKVSHRGVTIKPMYVLFHSGWPSQWYQFTVKGEDGKVKVLPQFVIDGVTYNCAEQYMMAQKAKMFKADALYKSILSETSPRKMKSMGRKIPNYDSKTWDACRSDIVTKANLAKFSQNPDLRQKLLDTELRVLIEASPTDKIWGVGMDAKDLVKRTDQQVLDIGMKLGQNLLGKALMTVRAHSSLSKSA